MGFGPRGMVFKGFRIRCLGLGDSGFGVFGVKKTLWVPLEFEDVKTMSEALQKCTKNPQGTGPVLSTG